MHLRFLPMVITLGMVMLLPFGQAGAQSVCHQSNWDHPRHYTGMEWVGHGSGMGANVEFLAQYHLRNYFMSDYNNTISLDRLCLYVYVPSNRSYSIYQVNFEVDGPGKHRRYTRLSPDDHRLGYSIDPGQGGYYSAQAYETYNKSTYSRAQALAEGAYGYDGTGSIEVFFWQGSNWLSGQGKEYSHNGASCMLNCTKPLYRYRGY